MAHALAIDSPAPDGESHAPRPYSKQVEAHPDRLCCRGRTAAARLARALGIRLAVFVVSAASCAPATRPPVSVQVVAPGPPAVRPTFFPDPPATGSAWTAPATGLHPRFVEAVAPAFALGIADPRGCEYREVEIEVGSIWGGGGILTTHAWVFPTRAGAHAVAWNGLVYAVDRTGAPADLEADVAAALEWSDIDTLTEPVTALHRSKTAIKLALLLRLGRADLAERYAAGLPLLPSDAYAAFVSEWTWNQWERALAAHMRGADDLARATLEHLRGLVDVLATEHARLRAGNHELRRGSDWLRDVDDLLVDQRRRADAVTPRPTVAGGNASIDALVAALDGVAGRQRFQPGMAELLEDPVSRALVARGEAAVEPLLQALARDARLTRSVSFHRDFKRSRHVHAVGDVAFAILDAILEVSEHDMLERGSVRARVVTAAARRDAAARLRDDIVRWRATSIAELAGKRLASDLDVESWPVAASLLERAVLREGDRLRQASPEIVPLLVRRLESTADPRVGCRLASALAAWDPLHGRAALNVQTERLARASVAGEDAREHAACLVHLVEMRAKAGDRSSYDRYAAWVLRVEPGRTFDEDVLEPLWRLPDAPVLARTRRKVLADPRWRPRATDVPGGALFHLGGMLRDPFLREPILRNHVLAGLQDGTVVATIAYYRNETVISNAAGSLFQISAEPPPGSPPPGTRAPLRVADLFAWMLSETDGAPELDIRWPEPKRDEAIAALRRFLAQPH
jgi:hypothetical protein